MPAITGLGTNPTARKIFSYCEGDTTLVNCSTDAEYVEQLRAVANWNRDNECWKGIDPGFGDEMKAQFVALGLSDLLY
jgi:hypothetical protein